MNKTYIAIIIIVLAVIGIFFVLNSKKSEAPTINSEQSTTIPENTTTPEQNPATTETGTSANLETTNPNANVKTNVNVSTPAVKEFTVTGKNFSFSPSTITVNKGDKVKITFQNTQGMHNFIIDEFGVATKTAKSPDTEVLEFTASKTGSFEYYCSVGSHRAMGMKGTLIVK